LVFFAIAQSLVLSAVLFAWLSGRVAFDTSARVLFATPTGKPVAGTPMAAQAVAAFRQVAPENGANASLAADSGAFAPAEAHREAVAAAGSDEKRRAPAGDAPTTRTISEPSASLQNPRSAAPISRRSNNAGPSRSEPAWALPPVRPSSTPGDSGELGANGAPILD
jgi:hypothetical protein